MLVDRCFWDVNSRFLYHLDFLRKAEYFSLNGLKIEDFTLLMVNLPSIISLYIG